MSDPRLEVLAGTRGTFRLRANSEVRDPVFVFMDRGERETRTRMLVDADDPNSFSLPGLLLKSGAYRIEFSDRWSYTRRNPPEHRIIVRPDMPPVVEITVPAADAVPDGVVDITQHPLVVAVASDDVRVEDMVLVQDFDGREVRVGIPDVTTDDWREVSARIGTDAFGLAPGQRRDAWFEVVDNRVLPGGQASPQMARSRVLTLVWPVEADVEGDGSLERGEREAGAEEERSSSDDGEHEEGDGPAEGTDAGDASETSEASEPNDLEGELERFVEEHGDMARDVVRRLREGGDSGQAEDGEQGASADEASAEQAGSESAEQTQSSSAGETEGETASDQSEQSSESDAAAEDADASESASDSDSSSSDQAGGESAGEQSSEQQPASGEQADGQANEAGDQAVEGTAGEGEDTQPTDGGPAEVGGQGKEATGSPETPTDDETVDDAEPEPSSPEAASDTPIEPGGLAETVELLEILRRGGTLTEDMLVEEGWPRAKAAAFVKALQRVYERARRAGWPAALQRILVDTQVGEADVQRGMTLAGDVAQDVGPIEALEDELRRIAPPPEQRVPGRLQSLLEAYYRSLAEARERERK